MYENLTYTNLTYVWEQLIHFRKNCVVVSLFVGVISLERIYFKGCSLDKFLVKNFCLGAKTSEQGGITTRDIRSPRQHHLPLGYQALLFCFAKIAFTLANNFTSEKEQLRSLNKKLQKYTNFRALFIWLLVVNCRHLISAAHVLNLDDAKRRS